MYYSNCLIEAVKYKLKDWKRVKITYIPARYNECYCPHFLWSDGKYDYDFGVRRWLSWWERLWFKGEIRQRQLGWNEKYKKFRIDACRRRCMTDKEYLYEINKYIQEMIEYEKKNPEEAKRLATESLIKTGVLDKDGNKKEKICEVNN